MHQSFVKVLLVLVVGLLGATLPAAAAPPRQQSDLCFDAPMIAHCVDERFRAYWEQNGGQRVFGYPISEAQSEANPETEQMLLTQWFERARFEHHPTNPAPYDVQLGRIGAERLDELGVTWQELTPEAGPHAGCLWFEQTRHNVCDTATGPDFLAFWQTLDNTMPYSFERSLGLFGQPLIGVSSETTGSTGTILTQWFKRARFEYTVIPPSEPRVMLGLLGNELRGDGSTRLPPGAMPEQ